MRLTVNRNGHSFTQDEAIRTHEGWNTAQRIELEIFGVNIGRASLNQFDVKVICFRNDKQYSRARIILDKEFGQYFAKKLKPGHGSEGSIEDIGTYHKAIELSERHLEQCHNTIQVLWLRSGGVGCRNNFLDFDTFRGGQSHSSRGSAANHSRPSPAAHLQKLWRALSCILHLGKTTIVAVSSAFTGHCSH